MRRVIIESPWQGNIRKHRNYARRCVKDCLKRGEAPIASHLLFTQPGILKDTDSDQRWVGIFAGLQWSAVADAAVFYADYGFSVGMLEAVKHHAEAGTPIEIRYLFAPRKRSVERSRAKADSGNGGEGGGSEPLAGISNADLPGEKSAE